MVYTTSHLRMEKTDQGHAGARAETQAPRFRTFNKPWYRLAHWPIWIFVFFIVPGPLTFDLLERGFDVRMAAWLGVVLLGTGIAGWRGRDESAGPMWYFDNGKLVSDTTTPGTAGHHGARLPFQVATRAPEHPIMKGLPPVWMHTADELYGTLRGPGKDMTVLATAHSDLKNKGTGRDEPMLMAIAFGEGRVFHTPMGHDVAALSCVGFITLFQRGTEWAATGKVTQKAPANFPTAKSESVRVDILEMDPAFLNGASDPIREADTRQ